MITSSTTWRKVRAEDVCLRVTDGTHDTPKRLNSGHPLITSKQLTGGNLAPTDYFISEEDFKEINKRSKVDNWDILFGMIGTIGEKVIVKDKNPQFAIKNIGLFKTGGDKELSKWLYYYFKSPAGTAYIKSVTRGTSQGYVPLGSLRDFPILITDDKKERERIVAILYAFDDKIELNNKISRTLEQMAQVIFKKWFVNFKFPGHEKIKIVDSELGKIPKGWEVKKVKEVCDQIVNGGTPRREVREYWANGNIPWVTTSELQNQVIIETTEKISKIGYENSSAKLLPQNTIIIALYASPTLGRLGLLKIEATTNQACSALVAKEEMGYGYLFYWLLNQREYLQGLAVGAAQQNINQEVIRELNILVPDNQLLKRFQEVVSRVFDTLTNNTKENQKLAALRDLLLPKLMSGGIRV